MVDWRRFDPDEWQIRYDIDKLAAHGVEVWEASEAILNSFVVHPNKRAHGPDRYQLVGRTDAGRPLILIVHVSGARAMSVITGWRL